MAENAAAVERSPWSDLPADVFASVLALLPPEERRAARAACSSWRAAFDARYGPCARPLLPVMTACASGLVAPTATTTSFPSVRTLLIPAVRRVGGGRGGASALPLRVAASAPFPRSRAGAAPAAHRDLAAALGSAYPRTVRADLSGWRGPGAINAALALPPTLRALDLGGAELFGHVAALEAPAPSRTATVTAAPIPVLALKTGLRRLSLAGCRLPAQAHAGGSVDDDDDDDEHGVVARHPAARAQAAEASLALLQLRAMPRLRALDLGRLPPDARSGWPLHARGLLEGGDGCSAGGGWTTDVGRRAALPGPSLRDRAIAGIPPFFEPAVAATRQRQRMHQKEEQQQQQQPHQQQQHQQQQQRPPRPDNSSRTLNLRFCCALLPPGLTRLDLLLQPLSVHDVRDIRVRQGPTLRSLSLSWGSGPGALSNWLFGIDPFAHDLVLAARAGARAFDAEAARSAAEAREAAALSSLSKRRRRGDEGEAGDDSKGKDDGGISRAMNAAWQARAAVVAAGRPWISGAALEPERTAGATEDEAAYSEDADDEEEEEEDPEEHAPAPPPLARVLSHLGALPVLRCLELHLPLAGLDLGGDLGGDGGGDDGGGWPHAPPPPPAPLVGLTSLHGTLEDLTLGGCPTAAMALSLAALTRLTALRLVGGEGDGATNPQQGPFGSPDDWAGGAVRVTAQAVAHVARSLPRLRLLRVTARLPASGVSPPGDELLSQLLFAGGGAGELRVLQLPCMALHGTGLMPPGGGQSEEEDEEGEGGGETDGDSDSTDGDDYDEEFDEDGRGRGCCWSSDGSGSGSGSGDGERAGEGEEEEEGDDAGDAARARWRPPPRDENEQPPRQHEGGGGAGFGAGASHLPPPPRPRPRPPPRLERLELDASLLMHGALPSLRRLRRSLRSLTLRRACSVSFASACRRGCYLSGVGALTRLTSLRVLAPARGFSRRAGGGGTAATWAAPAAAAAEVGPGALPEQQQGFAPVDPDQDEDEGEDEAEEGSSIAASISDGMEGEDDDDGDDALGMFAAPAVAAPHPPPPNPAARFEPHLQFLALLPGLRELELSCMNTLLSSALRPLSSLPRLRRCALGGTVLALDRPALAAASAQARWPSLRVLALKDVGVVIPSCAGGGGRARPRLAYPMIDDLFKALLDRGSGDDGADGRADGGGSSQSNSNNKPQLEAVHLSWGDCSDEAVAEALELSYAQAASAEEEAEAEAAAAAGSFFDREHNSERRVGLTEDAVREAARRAPPSLRFLSLSAGFSMLHERAARSALHDSPVVWAEHSLSWSARNLLLCINDEKDDPLLLRSRPPATLCLPDEPRASDGEPPRGLEWRLVRLPAEGGQRKSPLVSVPFFSRESSGGGHGGARAWGE